MWCESGLYSFFRRTSLVDIYLVQIKDSISPPVEICEMTSGVCEINKMKIVAETRQEEENRSKEFSR